MRSKFLSLIFLIIILFFQVAVSSNDSVSKQTAVDMLKNMPVAFRKNAGQWDNKILYTSSVQSWNASVCFLKNEISYTFLNASNYNCGNKNATPYHAPDVSSFMTWNASFVNSNKNVRVTAGGEAAGRTNYILGRDPQKYVTNVPDYRMLTYHDIYSGIDLEYFSTGKNLKHNYILHPGADISSIKIACKGIKNLSINRLGQLEINTHWGILLEELPESYQFNGDKKQNVKIVYRLINDTTYGYEAQDYYDIKQTLIIDPVTISWGTFVVGDPVTSHGYLYDITLDGNGDIYGTGFSRNNFCITPGVFDTSYNGQALFGDVFVFKLSSNGSNLIYSTYIGGSDDEVGNGIVVNSAGHAFVTGGTASANFPVTAGVYDTQYNCGPRSPFVRGDAFVLELNTTGTALDFSTFLGGSSVDEGVGIVIDANNNSYVTGYSTSNDFPVQNAFVATYGGTVGGYDGFITKLNSTGTALVYSTYLCGAGADAGLSITLNAANEAFVTGFTESSGFPTTAGAYDQTHNGGEDVFAVRLSAAGNAAIYSTFLGGTQGERPHKIVINSGNEAFITGGTSSANFPVTAGAYDITYNGGATGDVFVCRLAGSGSSLIYSTFVGGIANEYREEGQGIAINSANEAFVSGVTSSDNFPITQCAFDTVITDSLVGMPGARYHYDAFLLKLNASGSSLMYSTFIGGSAAEYNMVRVMLYGDSCEQEVVMGGTTHSNDFPTTAGTFAPLKADTNWYQDFPVVFKLKADVTPSFLFPAPVCPNAIVTFTNTTDTCGLFGPLNSYSWDFGDGSTSFAFSPTHSYSSAGSYNVKFKLACPADSITMLFTVSPFPNADAGLNDSICRGDTASLTATGGISYLWNTGDTLPAIFVSPSGTTNYTVEVSDGTCIKNDTVKVVVFNTAAVSAGLNASILPGQTITLSASNGVSYSWKPSNSLSCTTCQYPIATPTVTTEYCVTVVDANGCSDSACVIITVDIACGQLFVPTAFSPNGDAQNDVLHIYGNCITEMLFTIYNRWGEIVFETNDITNVWDGAYKGQPMNTGVFFYQLSAIFNSGETLNAKGNISLVR